MKSTKKRLLLAAITVAAFIATPLIARTLHTPVALGHQAQGTDFKITGTRPAVTNSAELHRTIICDLAHNVSGCEVMMEPMSFIKMNTMPKPLTKA